MRKLVKFSKSRVSSSGLSEHSRFPMVASHPPTITSMVCFGLAGKTSSQDRKAVHFSLMISRSSTRSLCQQRTCLSKSIYSPCSCRLRSHSCSWVRQVRERQLQCRSSLRISTVISLTQSISASVPSQVPILLKNRLKTSLRKRKDVIWDQLMARNLLFSLMT